MYMKIYPNETETILTALKSYQDTLSLQIGLTKKSKDNWKSDEIVLMLEKRNETLTRVIDRVNEM